MKRLYLVICLLSGWLVFETTKSEAVPVRGTTALMVAARNGDVAQVKELLAAGANPNMQHKIFEYTALMSAVTNGDLPTVRALVAGGADRKLRDMNGRTALDRARDLEDEVPGLMKAILP